MTPQYNTDVLIVGAGPTGLTAAVALAKFGLKIKIIDKNPIRSDKSKALGVQAGTLECFKNLIDKTIVSEMLKAGFPTRSAWIHLGSSNPLKVDLSTIPSEFNYILILEQSETERILETNLNRSNIQVERQTELLSFVEDRENISSTLVLPTGENLLVRSRFLIGCDGAHSKVRHTLDLPFLGGAYTGNFILGDVTLDWPWPYDSIQTFISHEGVIASFPMKGEKRYRLILVPHKDTTQTTKDSSEISLADFRLLTSRLSKNQIQVNEGFWLTRFRVHHRMVERFQKGNVFLAGDSAHIHSPAGGQGMNTGIQDAINLAFKIKKVALEHAPLETLKDYEIERLPIARQVVRSTDFAFRMAILPPNFFVKFIQRFLLPLVVRSKFIQHRVAKAISQVSMAREEINRNQ